MFRMITTAQALQPEVLDLFANVGGIPNLWIRENRYFAAPEAQTNKKLGAGF